MLLQEFEIKTQLRDLLLKEHDKSFTINELEVILNCGRFEVTVAVWELIDSKEASVTKKRNAIVGNKENILKLKEVNGSY